MSLNNVPQSGQTLGQTRVPINQNFSVIDTAFTVDHVSYNTAGQGKHNKVTFPLNPGAVFAANEIGLFNQNAVPTNRPDVWMARGVAAAFPITGYDNGGSVAWSYLPSGLKIIGGNNTTSAGTSGNRTIVFASTAGGGLDSFPGFNSFIMTIQVTRVDPSTPGGQNFVGIKSYNNAQCIFQNMNGSGTASNFLWLAIGL